MRWRWAVGGLPLLVACSGSATSGPTLSSSPTQPIPLEGKIAITRLDGSHQRIYVINADGSGLVKISTGDSWEDFIPAWSPNGQHIVFVRSYSPYGQKDLYVANADGSGTERLTSTPTNEETPAWSPDGKRIAFADFLTRGKDAHLWVMNADGSARMQLTRGPPTVDMVPSWSPDGRRIVFERHFDDADNSSNADLFLMDANGSHLVRLTHDHARNAAWSPDGTRIAYWADSAGDPIKILDLSSGNATTLLEADSVTFVGSECGVVPTWSPDGTEIAWAGCEADPTDLYVMAADGTHLTKIPNTQGSSDPAWMPMRNGA